MQVNDVLYLSKENNLFLDLRKDNKRESKINYENLQAITIEFIISPIDKSFEYLRPERILLKIRKEHIDLIDDHVIFFLELDELRNPNLFQIKIVVLKILLTTEDRFEIPIKQQFILSDIRSDEISDMFKKERQSIERDNTKKIEKEFRTNILSMKENPLLKDVIKSNKKNIFYEFTESKLIQSFKDSFKDDKLKKIIKDIDDLDLESIKIDIKEILLEIIFSLLKSLCEFDTLKELNISHLFRRFFHKFFASYFKSVPGEK